MFIKTRTKHASKDEIELAVFKAFREVLIEVLSFGFGIVELASQITKVGSNVLRCELHLVSPGLARLLS